jgi:hypothetical protein
MNNVSIEKATQNQSSPNTQPKKTPGAMLEKELDSSLSKLALLLYTPPHDYMI